MPVVYDANPIIEAVWEFAPIQQSLGGGLAALRERYRVRYTGDADTVAGSFGVDIADGPNGPSFRQHPQGPPRQRLWTNDRHRLIQFGADLLAFNALAPYTHYSDYLPALREDFREYVRAAQPVGVQFLGQRFINRVPLPNMTSDPHDYFSVYPRLPAEQGRPLHPPLGLQVQVEEIQRGQVVLSLAYQGPDATQRPSYVLDVYARTVVQPGIPFDWNHCSAWQQLAHAAINRTFDFALTEIGRTLLGRREVP